MCTSDSSLTCTNYIPGYEVFIVLAIIAGLFGIFVGICYIYKKCKSNDVDLDPRVFNPRFLRGDDSDEEHRYSKRRIM